MRKLLTIMVLVLGCFGAAQDSRAQACPGVSPWVFDDVLASDTFCTYITWMAQEGVSLGCIVIDANHRLFCPDNNVTRKQMSAFMFRLGEALLPSTCGAGQILKWNGTQWACANDNAGGVGTVTSVAAGTGLTGGTITSAGTIAADTTYLQRRVVSVCAAGSSIRTINADGSVVCQVDSAGTGTVTSVATGVGLTGGPVTVSGTIAADTTYLQRRVASSCAVGSSIRVIAADGSVTCQLDSAGPANAFVQGGNAFGTVAVLGTSDDNALDIRVNGSSVMRYLPDPVSPNVVGGHPSNNPGTVGTTVAGGGRSGTNCQDPVTGNVTRPCQNAALLDFDAVGGGYSNRASGGISLVAGGAQNNASGYASTVAGGAYSIASGNYSTVAGGTFNVASGNGSFAAGTWAKTQTAGASPTIHHGAFVFADSNFLQFNTAASNEFAVRATGGMRFVTAIDGGGNPTRTVRINESGNLDFGSEVRQMLNLWGPANYGIGVQESTLYFRSDPGFSNSSAGGFSWFRGGFPSDLANNPGSGGVEVMRLASNGTLYVTGGTVGTLSDKASKQDFAAVDRAEVLARVVRLPLTTWSYRANPGVRHIGPTAQDFSAAFGVGDDDARSISMVDADGVALAAIQGLNAKLEAQAAQHAQEITALKASHSAEIAELKRAVEVLLARTSPEGRVAAR